MRDLDLAASVAFAGIVEIPLTDDVLIRARRIGSEALRSLDAVHLVSALHVGAGSMLTYDDRLANAATLLGFVVLRPPV